MDVPTLFTATLVACYFSTSARWVAATLTAAYLLVLIPVNRLILRKKSTDTERFDGLKVIIDRQARSDNFDIIAVHGLGAHPNFTWSRKLPHTFNTEFKNSSGNSGQRFSRKPLKDNATLPVRVDWLTDFIPGDFEDASILKFSHNADWFLDAPRQSPRVAAKKLLSELRAVDRRKPIVFVGHSYGGLVIKEAVYIAGTDEQYTNIYDLIKGIVFLGTPHQGSKQSSIANLLAFFTTALGSSTTLTTFLAYGGTDVTDLDHRFWQKWRGKIVVHNLYETRPTFWKGVYVGMIVDVGAGRPLVCDRAVDADHSGLNKCTNRSDDVYKAIYAAIDDIQTKTGFAEDLMTRAHVDELERDVLPQNIRHVFDEFQERQASSKDARIPLSDSPASQRKREEKATTSSFYVYDYRRAWMNISANIQPGTCLWFTLRSKEFLWWMESGSSSRLLWLTGPPAAGKTSLTAHAVRSLIDRTRLGMKNNKVEEAVLYSFCDDKINSTSREILASIIHQFMWAYPTARSIGHQWHKDRRIDNQNSSSYGRDTDISTLWRMLCETIDICCEEGHLARVFLNIDGVDQCSEQTSRELLRLFVVRSKNLWIMVSSQPSEHMLSILKGSHDRGYQALRFKHMDVTKHSDDINADIDLVIRRKVGALSSKRKWDANLERQIIEELQQNKRGEFLTINFAIKELGEGTSPHVLERLRDLLAKVTSLESYNDQLLANIPPALRQRQSRILKYVMYTMRPLTITELATACGYWDDRGLMQSPDPIASPDARTLSLRKELSEYGQMLKVSDPDNTVDFFHPSIRLYLVRKSRDPPPSLEPFLTPEHTAKVEIAVTCMEFLRSLSSLRGMPESWMDNFTIRTQRLNGRVPLYSYALRYWVAHVREAVEISTHHPQHRSLLLRHLQHIRHIIKSQPYSNFVRQLTTSHGRSMFAVPPETMTDLDFFAALGISSQVETILGIDYSQQMTTLVRYLPSAEAIAAAAKSAAQNGHRHTFELLFDLLEPELDTEQFLNGVLLNAVHGGDGRIVRRVLLHYKPSPTELIEAVLRAVADDDCETIDALQACPDVLQVTDKAGRNAMHYLALRYFDKDGFFDEVLYKDTYKFFDSAGVSIKTQDIYGDTPLHHVTMQRPKSFEVVIRTLVELGVDPTVKNKRKQTALHFASWRGSFKAVAALLEYMPSSQAVERSLGDLTPLHWAMQRHDYDDHSSGVYSDDGYHVVRALRNLGADFDARSKEGRTPLTIAAENPDVTALVWRFASSPGLSCVLLQECFSEPRELAWDSGHSGYTRRDECITRRVEELETYDVDQSGESGWSLSKRLTWNSDELDYEAAPTLNAYEMNDQSSYKVMEKNLRCDWHGW